MGTGGGTVAAFECQGSGEAVLIGSARSAAEAVQSVCIGLAPAQVCGAIMISKACAAYLWEVVAPLTHLAHTGLAQVGV